MGARARGGGEGEAGDGGGGRRAPPQQAAAAEVKMGRALRPLPSRPHAPLPTRTPLAPDPNPSRLRPPVWCVADSLPACSVLVSPTDRLAHPRCCRSHVHTPHFTLPSTAYYDPFHLPQPRPAAPCRPRALDVAAQPATFPGDVHPEPQQTHGWKREPPAPSHRAGARTPLGSGCTISSVLGRAPRRAPPSRPDAKAPPLGRELAPVGQRAVAEVRSVSGQPASASEKGRESGVVSILGRPALVVRGEVKLLSALAVV